MCGPNNPKGFGLPGGAYPKRVTAGFCGEKASLSPPASSLLVTDPLRVVHAHPLWSLQDTLPARRLPGTQSLSRHVGERFAYSPDVTVGRGSMNSIGRVLVGVAVKPPDESFHGLETAPPDSLPPLHYHTDSNPRRSVPDRCDKGT